MLKTMTNHQLADLGIREAQRVQRLRQAAQQRKAGLVTHITAAPRDAMRGVQEAANELIRRAEDAAIIDYFDRTDWEVRNR